MFGSSFTDSGLVDFAGRGGGVLVELFVSFFAVVAVLA
jgi:hypothetical protein